MNELIGFTSCENVAVSIDCCCRLLFKYPIYMFNSVFSSSSSSFVFTPSSRTTRFNEPHLCTRFQHTLYIRSSILIITVQGGGHTFLKCLSTSICSYIVIRVCVYSRMMEREDVFMSILTFERREQKATQKAK